MKRKRPRSENRPKRPLHSPPRLEILEDRTMPTVYTVTLPTDNNPGGGGQQDPNLPAAANAGDLRYCLTQAEKGAGNSVVFGNQVSNQTITLQAQLPDISQNTTITNQPGVKGVTVARSNTAPDFRIFQVDTGVTATLGAFTISKGSTTKNGGGILNDGTLTLNGTTVSGNSATGGASGGGGIANDAGAALKLNGGSVSGNFATLEGAGIYNLGSVSTLPGASLFTIAGNQTTSTNTGLGSGLYDGANASATLNNDLIQNNITQGNGGGIYVLTKGNVILANSTLAGNQAVQGDGGAIYNKGAITLTNDTFNNNSAGGPGGAIRNYGGGQATNITVNGNKSSGGAVVSDLGNSSLPSLQPWTAVPISSFCAWRP
jgi:hypothetical protein